MLSKLMRWAAMLPRRIAQAPIKFYRKFISPAKPVQSCRFTPTCSEYALAAIEEWGVLAGTYLALRRVLRCHPWNPGGYDPVPKRGDWHKRNNK